MQIEKDLYIKTICIPPIVPNKLHIIEILFTTEIKTIYQKNCAYKLLPLARLANVLQTDQLSSQHPGLLAQIGEYKNLYYFNVF